MKAVRVSVPASSGNLGSGFDVLAAALALRLDLEVSFAPRGGASFGLEGEGADRLPRGARNLVFRILKRHLGARPLKVRMTNRIPVARGFGSSGAARLAAHAAGLALLGRDPGRALALAAADEGHPDNVAASFLGGITAVLDAQTLDAHRVPVPKRLKAVVCVPAFELATELAREALPDEVPLEDAVFNLSRALGWLAALESGRFERLARATEDSLHQPYRASLVPGLRGVIEAALKTGAYGACLSGAGPSVLAVCRAGSDLEAIGRRMAAAFARRGVQSSSRALAFDNAGLKLERG